MRKLLFLLSCIMLLFPAAVWGQTDEQLQAAFIRNGHLWVIIGNEEEQISSEPAEYYNTPKWSYDGQWIVYEKEAKEPISHNLDGLLTAKAL